VQEQNEIKQLLKEYDCIPVFFDEETISKYCAFYETVIRPIFHNFKDFTRVENDEQMHEQW
jgi:trehalose 6-phosphate synthase/phosphatase